MRYLLLAKIHLGYHYLLRFDRDELLDVLNEFPTTKGIDQLAKWPIDTLNEMLFFTNMMTRSVEYYYLVDFKTKQKKVVHIFPPNS